MKDFKLSKLSLSTIEHFSKINNSIIFRPGKNFWVVSKDQDVIAYSELDNVIPDRFAVGDISKFLSVLSLFDDASFTVQDGKILVIKSDSSRRKFSFTLAGEKLIPSTEKENHTFLEQFGEPTTQFTLKGKDLTVIKKALVTGGLPTLRFAAQGDNIVATALDTSNPTSDSFEMDIDATAQHPFTVAFSDRKIIQMHEYDYVVSVFGGKMVHFKSPTALEYFNAPERGAK